jgi:hypothetical protein
LPISAQTRAAQAAPFLKFDADMRRQLARAKPFAPRAAAASLAREIRRFFDPMMIWVALCFVSGVALIVRALAGGAL